MGSQSKYDKKFWVYVDITIPTATNSNTPGEAVKYGFSTNFPETKGTELGHTKITDLAKPPQKLVVGCSFPKPRRASLRVSTTGARYYSSFIAQSKINAAKNKGWRVQRTKTVSKIILASNSASFVQTVYVTIEGIKYAWNIPKVTFKNIDKDASAIGLKEATTGDRDELCFGANFPVPPRATKVIPGSGEDGPKYISTFYDPSSKLPSLWTPSKPGIYSLI